MKAFLLAKERTSIAKTSYAAVIAAVISAATNPASAQSGNHLLSRLETLEKRTAELERLKKDNDALRERVRRLEAEKRVAPPAAPKISRPEDAYASALPALAFKAPPPQAAASRWAGPYVGAFGGYGWGMFFPPNGPADTAAEVKSRGGFAGVEAGYNVQVAPHWVFGVQQDVWAGRISGTQAQAVTPTIHTEIQYAGTFRGRFGYTTDQAFLYSTGGVVWAAARINLDCTPPQLATCNSGDPNLAHISQTRWHFGVALGEGLEWAVRPDVSLKAEYLFLHLAKEQYFSTTAASAVAGLGAHTFRVGVNWLLH